MWRLLRNSVGKQFPKTNVEVQRYIKKRWKKLSVQNFKMYLDEVHNRCLAIINANGGHTKW